MKRFRIVAALLVAFMLVAGFAPYASAGVDQGNSITIELKAPHKRVQGTVTVRDHVIRGYLGQPIEAITIQTASGRTKIPIENISEIKMGRCISRRTDDIPRIEHVVKADIILVDGTRKNVVMNADFGTIEGKTDRGDFYLGDPLTVKHIVFHR